MRNPLDLIRGIFTKPVTVPPQTIKEFPRVIDQLKADHRVNCRCAPSSPRGNSTP